MLRICIIQYSDWVPIV